MKKRILFLLVLLFLFVGCDKTSTTNITTLNPTTSSTTTQSQTQTPITGVPGVDGREVLFQISSGYIQWKYEGETTWNNLLAIDSLTGQAGLGIAEFIINDLGELVITYTDDSTENLGEVLKLNVVQFLDNTGKVISVQLVRDNCAAIPPTPPVVEGLYFNHWGEDFSNVTQDLVVHAYYLPESYTITFNSQGGNPLEASSFYTGQPITLPTPVRAGYNFLGWFLGVDANSRQIFNYDTLSSNITVYARWLSTNAVTVYTEEDLANAIEDFSCKEIYFGADITVYDEFQITHPLTIYGNGYSLETKNQYSLFYVSANYYNYSYSESYPVGGYLTINDLNIIGDTDSEGLSINTLIGIYELNDFDLNLNNVNIGGSFYIAIEIVYSEDINVMINDSNIDVIYTPVYLVYANQINFQIIRTDFSAVSTFFLNGVYDTQIIMSSSNINLKENPEPEIEPAFAFNSYESYNNDYIINDTIFTTESSLPTGIAKEMYGYGPQGFYFTNCTFEVNNPIFEELFFSGSESVYFEFYNSTIVVMEGITEIPGDGFADVYGINNYILPESLLTIGDYAFYNNYYLTSIVIPENVTNIGTYAFYGCDLLSAIAIPASVTFVGENAFYVPYTDLTIYLLAGVDTTAWDLNWNSSENQIITDVVEVGNLDGVIYVAKADYTIDIIDFIYQGKSDIVIPDYLLIGGETYTFTAINQFAFSFDDKLRSIHIPNTITTIGNYAFEEATKLKTLTFQENSTLTSIGEGAFSYCYNLRSIFIPASVTYIGEAAFYQNDNLTSVVFESGIMLEEIPGSAFAYNYRLAEIIIPASVVEIGSYAFTGNQALKNVVFESNSVLETIGDGAFQSNNSLKEFNLPSSVIYIGQQAFNYSSNLQTFNIPLDSNLEYIGNQAFYYCERLATIQLPDTITYIGDSAFNYCISLTSINIPASLTELRSHVFAYCRNIETVTFAENSQLTTIGLRAFLENLKLTSIHLPASVTTIGEVAFMNCFNLTEVSFANIYNLTRIDKAAFYNCYELETFFIPSSVTTMGEYVFRFVTDITIYAEAASKPAGWNDLWSSGSGTVVWNANYLVVQPNNGEDAIIIYAAIGDTISTPEGLVLEGYVIEGWYTDEALTIAYVFDTMPSEKITVYVKWLPAV